MISPQWIESASCRAHLEYALQLNKKIVPVVTRKCEALPSPLDQMQLVFMYSSQSPSERKFAVTALMAALSTDIKLTIHHTDSLVKALEWHREERSPRLFLQGPRLAKAGAWLQQAAQGRGPRPLSSQVEYLIASHHIASRRNQLRISYLSLALLALITISLGGVACFCWSYIRASDRSQLQASASSSPDLVRELQVQLEKARKESARAQRRRLVSLAQANQYDNLQFSLLVAIESLNMTRYGSSELSSSLETLRFLLRRSSGRWIPLGRKSIVDVPSVATFSIDETFLLLRFQDYFTVCPTETLRMQQPEEEPMAVLSKCTSVFHPKVSLKGAFITTSGDVIGMVNSASADHNCEVIGWIRDRNGTSSSSPLYVEDPRRIGGLQWCGGRITESDVVIIESEDSLFIAAMSYGFYQENVPRVLKWSPTATFSDDPSAAESVTTVEIAARWRPPHLGPLHFYVKWSASQLVRTGQSVLTLTTYYYDEYSDNPCQTLNMTSWLVPSLAVVYSNSTSMCVPECAATGPTGPVVTGHNNMVAFMCDPAMVMISPSGETFKTYGRPLGWLVDSQDTPTVVVRLKSGGLASFGRRTEPQVQVVDLNNQAALGVTLDLLGETQASTFQSQFLATVDSQKGAITLSRLSASDDDSALGFVHRYPSVHAILDMQSGQPLHPPVFSPKGNWLLSLSTDGMLLYDFEQGSLQVRDPTTTRLKDLKGYSENSENDNIVGAFVNCWFVMVEPDVVHLFDSRETGRQSAPVVSRPFPPDTSGFVSSPSRNLIAVWTKLSISGHWEVSVHTLPSCTATSPSPSPAPSPVEHDGPLRFWAAVTFPPTSTSNDWRPDVLFSPDGNWLLAPPHIYDIRKNGVITTSQILVQLDFHPGSSIRYDWLPSVFGRSSSLLILQSQAWDISSFPSQPIGSAVTYVFFLKGDRWVESLTLSIEGLTTPVITGHGLLALLKGVLSYIPLSASSVDLENACAIAIDEMRSFEIETISPDESIVIMRPTLPGPIGFVRKVLKLTTTLNSDGGQTLCPLSAQVLKISGVSHSKPLNDVKDVIFSGDSSHLLLKDSDTSFKLIPLKPSSLSLSTAGDEDEGMMKFTVISPSVTRDLMDVSYDSKAISLIGQDGMLQIFRPFDSSPTRLIKSACAIVGREFTEEERRTVFGDDDTEMGQQRAMQWCKIEAG